MLYEIKLDVDLEKLEQESTVCDFVPINRITLRRLQIDKNNNSYGSKFYDFVNKDDKEWWLKQQTWHSTVNADEDILTHMPETARILSMFKTILDTDNIEVNFLTQKHNTDVKPHTDVGTPCAINFIIKGSATPIVFDDAGKEFFYKSALLDVSKTHSVPVQEDTERLLLKFRLMDLSFEDAREKLVANGL